MIYLTSKTYNQAKEYIAERGYGSSKILQSKFKIGHLSAMFILETLTKYGFLGKPDFYGKFKIINKEG